MDKNLEKYRKDKNYEKIENALKVGGKEVMEKRKIKVKSNKTIEGYTEDVKQKIKERREMYSRYRKGKNCNKKNEYKNRYVKLKEQIKNNFEEVENIRINKIITKKFTANTEFRSVIREIKRKSNRKEEIKNEKRNTL